MPPAGSITVRQRALLSMKCAFLCGLSLLLTVVPLQAGAAWGAAIAMRKSRPLTWGPASSASSSSVKSSSSVIIFGKIYLLY